jgi:hypothetical protein
MTQETCNNMGCCRQRNRDTVEIGTLTFANFELSMRTDAANTHTLFVAEGAVKMSGIQALFALMLRRSLPFPAREDLDQRAPEPPTILTHGLGDLPALAAFMDHAGHSHKCGCPLCDLQADTASSLDKEVTHHTQTFARRLRDEGDARLEKDLRAATRFYKPQKRLHTVTNAVSALDTLSLPRNKPVRLPPKPVRRDTNDPLYPAQNPTNCTSSFQAACPLLCLEYIQLAFLSKSVDVMHNNYLGVAK